MSAVVARERRSTAGKRMSSLVGKALDDDEAFWGHDTWQEDDSSSGNESFRESDEESEARVDEFDSDFNDSESDHEDEEEAAGAEAEAQIQREEKLQKRKQKFDIAKAGRELMQKKRGRGKKRAMGDGINAGLVLNMPPSMAAAHVAPGGDGVAVLPKAPPTPIASPAKKPKAATRRYSPRSPGGRKRTLRAATLHKSQEAESKRKSAASTNATTTSSRKKQKRFTQEELLLEAATVTEPENERWLLARKRVQQTQDEMHKTSQEGKSGKVICKFRSRRGCLNTLSFPEMDYVPEILARKHVGPEKRTVPTVCVITGKKARYRDPKTMMGYHDIDAFKELRRRLNAGEKLDQRKKQKNAEADRGTALPDALTKKEERVRDDAAVNNVTSTTANTATSDCEMSSVAHTQKLLSNAPPPALVTGQAETPEHSEAAAEPPLNVAKPMASATLPSTGRYSPRKRKPSARAIAAVETERMSPGKASISNVIMNLTTAPQLEVSVVEEDSATSAPPQAQSIGDSKDSVEVGKQVLKRMAETDAENHATNESASNGELTK